MAKNFDEPVVSDSNDDSGWNSGRPIHVFNVKGVFRGRIVSCKPFMKADGKGQIVFEVLPLEALQVLGGELPDVDNLAEVGAQRFPQYVDTRDNRQIDRVRLLCKGLGSASAKQAFERVGTWAEEIAAEKPECFFQTDQPRAREGYPNVDDEGMPIYQISKISAKPIN